MITRPVLIVGAGIAIVGIVAALAIAGERLGDWTDAHPDKTILAWSLWNLVLLAMVVGLVLLWRRYRRSTRLPLANTSPNERL